MEKLIENVARASTATKVAAVAGIVILVTALNYFAMGLNMGPSISETETRIQRMRNEQARLDREYIEKTSIANNLNQFRREKELLEERLRQALAELPEDKNIDELLQLFQDRAQKAGLEIGTIEPQAAVADRFFARIPIPMTVTGTFHEIATFFDALGRMQRIVNVTDISLDSPKDVSGKVILNGKFLATTFMFVDASAKPPKGGAK
ncbi:type 4a pilus biogenesis protein PilO [Anaeromyxobacter sp. Red801]|uniref:type 4a pilus biogenesis protein PilO n=1 Tax=Anaeromyxobacter sp. Red801 TaxID=3411632 RepID=UPI003B9E42CF